MTRIGLSVLLLASVLLVTGCPKGGDGAKRTGSGKLDTDEQKFSYVIGQQIGNGLKAQGLKVDVDVVAESIGDAVKGNPSRLTPEEQQAVMGKMQAQMMAKQMGEAKENKEKADKFLADNKGKADVKSLPSGLQYQVMTDGKGAIPKATDTVKVHYKGTLLDGSEFDSSYKRGTPAEFPVNGVIRGWTEALQLMKTGSKWKLWIPPDLAYGEQGRPGIPANSMLTFEVELIGISGSGKDAPAAKPGAPAAKAAPAGKAAPAAKTH